MRAAHAWIRAARIGAALVACATLLAAQGDEWVRLEASHGTIEVRASQRGFAERLVTQWGRAHARVLETIAVAPPVPSRVVIGRDAADVSTRLETPLPSWIAGVALKGRATVGLNAASFAKRGSTPTSVLRHELCHLAIGLRTGERSIPRWLEEGICQVVGGRPYLAGTLANAPPLELDSLTPWSRITAGFPRAERDAARAYEQSFSFVSHLERVGGFELLRALVDATAEGRSVSEAFVSVTGRAMVDHEREWLDHERRRRRGWLAVAEIATPLAIAAVLVLFAFRRRRRRDRVLQDAMEREMAAEDAALDPR